MLDGFKIDGGKERKRVGLGTSRTYSRVPVDSVLDIIATRVGGQLYSILVCTIKLISQYFHWISGIILRLTSSAHKSSGDDVSSSKLSFNTSPRISPVDSSVGKHFPSVSSQ